MFRSNPRGTACNRTERAHFTVVDNHMQQKEHDSVASFRIISCYATIRQNLPFLVDTFSMREPTLLISGPNQYTKQCEQYIFIISHDDTSLYFANITQLLNLHVV